MLRNSKPRGKVFLFIIIILVPAIFFGIFKLNLFTIKKIEVKNDKANCIDENRLTHEPTILGKNLFLVDAKKIRELLKKNFICIKDINFSKNLLSKLRMEVIGRIPVASLYSIKDWEASASSLIENKATPSASQKEGPYNGDDEGVIFEKGNDLVGFPKVDIIGLDLALGINLPDDYLKKTFKILEELKHLGINNNQSFVFTNLVITSGNPKIIFRLDQDIDIQIASLQLIVQKAKIDSEVLEFIDLRFDKPLIKFAPKKR